MMNSRRFISSFRSRVSRGEISSSMANIAIDADVLGAMTGYAPAHILIDFPLYLMHLTDLTVTGNAIDIGLNVGLVGEENIGRSRNPVNPRPGRLLSTIKVSGQFLDLGFVCRVHLMTLHAFGHIGYGGMRRFVRVLMTECAIQLGAIRPRYMDPVVISYRLSGRIG